MVTHCASYRRVCTTVPRLIENKARPRALSKGNLGKNNLEFSLRGSTSIARVIALKKERKKVGKEIRRGRELSPCLIDGEGAEGASLG